MLLLVQLAVGALGRLLPWFLKRVALYLGMSALTVTGVDQVVKWLEGFIQSNFQQLPSQVLSIMALAQVDKGLALILSGVSLRMLLDGYSAGKKTVFKVKPK